MESNGIQATPVITALGTAAADAAAPWVQSAEAACTLPTAERPFRTAEFDSLFSDAVVSVHRPESLRLRLDLRAEPEFAARAADLAVRETRCCSFFEFAVVAGQGQAALEVTVPAMHRTVLDALADRAARAGS